MKNKIIKRKLRSNRWYLLIIRNSQLDRISVTIASLGIISVNRDGHYKGRHACIHYKWVSRGTLFGACFIPSLAWHDIHCIPHFCSLSAISLVGVESTESRFSSGTKANDVELTQNRFPEGLGPSSNTWPKCAPHFAHDTSVLTKPGFKARSIMFPPTVTRKHKKATITVNFLTLWFAQTRIPFYSFCQFLFP